MVFIRQTTIFMYKHIFKISRYNFLDRGAVCVTPIGKCQNLSVQFWIIVGKGEMALVPVDTMLIPPSLEMQDQPISILVSSTIGHRLSCNSFSPWLFRPKDWPSDVWACWTLHWGFVAKKRFCVLGCASPPWSGIRLFILCASKTAKPRG